MKKQIKERTKVQAKLSKTIFLITGNTDSVLPSPIKLLTNVFVALLNPKRGIIQTI